MKLSYDRKEDILMIELVPEGAIDHAEQAGPLIAHFTATGHLVLLEILDASEFLSQVIKTTLRCEREEVPLAMKWGRVRIFSLFQQLWGKDGVKKAKGGWILTLCI